MLRHGMYYPAPSFCSFSYLSSVLHLCPLPREWYVINYGNGLSVAVTTLWGLKGKSSFWTHLINDSLRQDIRKDPTYVTADDKFWQFTSTGHSKDSSDLWLWTEKNLTQFRILPGKKQTNSAHFCHLVYRRGEYSQIPSGLDATECNYLVKTVFLMSFVKMLRFTGKQCFEYSNFCNVKIALTGFFFLLFCPQA